jgi:hypothetical protein
MATKTLFDHLNAVSKDQKVDYWKTLSDGDRKTWSNFMILRFLSMHQDFIELIAELQPIVQELKPEYLYAVLIEAIPKGKYYFRYIKGKNEDKYEKWVVSIVSKHYEVSMDEATEYVHILYHSKGGKVHLKELLESYGSETKEIKKLKLVI